jgi:pentatricopeptide repeat protein
VSKSTKEGRFPDSLRSFKDQIYGGKKSPGVMDYNKRLSSYGNQGLLDKALSLFKNKEQNDFSLSKGPRVQADSSVDLTNYLEENFVGPVIMGSNFEELRVIYDTGSDGLAVITDLCSSYWCSESRFNTSKSLTYYRLTSKDTELQYGPEWDDKMFGFNSTDNVYLTVPDVGVLVYPFLAIYYLYDDQFEKTSNGILGLSRQDATY